MNRLFTIALVGSLGALGVAQAPAAQAPVAQPPASQTPAAPPGYQGRRTADGKPDLNGIWQSLTNANWDIQAHSVAKGRVVALGAEDAQPAGAGIVEGGPLPYLPAALAKKKDNFDKRFVADPELKCYMPGVPRVIYMPFPFQITQSAKDVLFVYEYAGAVRNINMGKPTKSPADTWMGWSNGHWEGDTLVVDVTGLNDATWFDRAGDFHSDELHVVERYTPVSSGIINYQATITDPQVFSRPWKISLPLYRRVEKNAQLFEFKCAEFAEDLIYGPLRRQPAQ
jgi:hypothetical protein